MLSATVAPFGWMGCTAYTQGWPRFGAVPRVFRHWRGIAVSALIIRPTSVAMTNKGTPFAAHDMVRLVSTWVAGVS
jgi:hypothetical protein